MSFQETPGGCNLPSKTTLVSCKPSMEVTTKLSPKKFTLSLTSRLPTAANAKCLHCPAAIGDCHPSCWHLTPSLLHLTPSRGAAPLPPPQPKAGISLGAQQCHGEHRTTFNPQLSPSSTRSLIPTPLQQGFPRLHTEVPASFHS